MLSGDKKTEDISGSTNDNLCDSLAMNFESNRIVVGTRRNDDTGNIKIYNYDPYDSGTATANTWVLAQTITGNSSSKFGKSSDMNYDGNRIVVGAPGENKVYVYDATSSSTNEWATYVSNTITGTSGSDFGWSVSIAKDNPTKLAIGSPSENKVYMYELTNSTWSQTWSNVATDVPNKVPLSASTDVYMNSNNASYGYSVDLSTFGNFLAIGAPGVLTTITSANSTYTGSSTIGDYYYDIGERLYGIARTGGVFQRGYIRCFTTSNVSATWQNSLGGSGTTGLGEVTQHGQLVYGSTICHLGNWPGFNNTDSWSLPGLGFSVSISFDGSKLVGGEPFYSVPGHQASIHKGKVRAWVYDDTHISDKFMELTSSAATWFGDKFGYAVKLDYNGGRLAVGSTKRWTGGSFNEEEDHGGIHVFDFSETAFYEVSQGNNDFSNETSHVAIAITNGKTVACGVRDYIDDYSGKVRFYHMVLTQVIVGNTLNGGYIAADSVFIGPNDNLENNSFRKRISFGGTFNDNKYEASEIENRSFSTNISYEGHSELFIVKKSIGSGGTGGRDMIRVKANEFQIHNYITRGSSKDDNKYDMYPRLTMNEEGNFKLNPEFLYGRQNKSTYSSCDVKALLDINGDAFCRGKLNAGHKDRSNTKGLTREQGILFYDTRDRDIINGITVYSKVQMSELQREYNTGTITGTVTYNDTESAFKIGTSTSRIHSTVGGYAIDWEGLKLACWIKLTKDHDQYNANGETILSAGNLSGHYSKCQIYSGGVQILYNSGYKLQASFTFTKDRWYHLFFYLNARQNTPTTGNNYIWIDSVSQTLTENTSGGSASAPINATDNFYVGSTSGSIVDAYIGMVHARNTNNGEGYILNATDLYTNGPPSERLSVGGDAIIEQKLGIGTTLPAYELDVVGDINFTGNIYQNSNLYGIWTASGSDIYYNSGNVGIGTSTPAAYTLDVVGNVNITGGLRANGAAGASGQVLTSSGGGAMTWTTVSGGGSSVWSLNSTNAYYNSGNVGIGTSTPAYKLDIAGTTGGDALISSHIDNDIILFDDQQSTTTFTGTLYGGATRDTDDNYIILASGVNSQNRTVSWPIHLPNYWTCEFDWLATATGADETQFIFYATVPITTVVPVDNSSSTANGFLVVFEFYGDDRIVIKDNSGTIVASSVVTFTSNSYYKVVITFNRGYLSVSMTLNTTILQLNHDFGEMSQAYTTGKYMGFGGRTGGVSSIQRVRNIKVTKGCPFVHQNNNLSYMNGNLGIGKTSPSYKLDVNGDINHTGAIINSSDDRLKENETRIENALLTICKLDPQTYDKRPDLESNVFTYEAGLIAQDIYYDVPELRYLIHVPSDATPSETKPESGSDIQVDPDYSDWGTTPASVNYIGLIPYLIKSIKELKDENDALKARFTALES